MKIRKFLTSLILICVSAICGFGCASLESFRVIDPYNEESVITDKFVVTLDKKKLGDNYTTVSNAVYDDMIAFRNYVKDWINSFQADYPDVYEDLNSGIICEVSPNQGEILSVTIGFADEYTFAMFYGIIELDDESHKQAIKDIGPFLSQMLTQQYKVEEMGLFLYKYAVLNNTNWFYNIEDYKFDGIGTEYYKKYSEMTGFDLDDVSVSQVFVYPDEKLSYVDDAIYNNADVVEKLEGFTFLGWDLHNKDEDFKMSMFKLAPNPAPWYVIAIAISVGVVFGVSVTIGVKKKKNNVEKVDVKGENDNNGR